MIPSVLVVQAGFQLGIHDVLTGIQGVPPADQEAERAGQGEEQQPLAAEQLNGQENGGQGAVHHPAEQGDHGNCRPERRVQPQDSSEVGRVGL